MSAIYISIISFVVPRLLSEKKTYPDKPIVYVDTFVKALDFDEEGGFIDRYYDGMAKNMSSKQGRKNVELMCTMRKRAGKKRARSVYVEKKKSSVHDDLTMTSVHDEKTMRKKTCTISLR